VATPWPEGVGELGNVKIPLTVEKWCGSFLSSAEQAEVIFFTNCLVDTVLKTSQLGTVSV